MKTMSRVWMLDRKETGTITGRTPEGYFTVKGDTSGRTWARGADQLKLLGAQA